MEVAPLEAIAIDPIGSYLDDPHRKRALVDLEREPFPLQPGALLRVPDAFDVLIGRKDHRRRHEWPRERAPADLIAARHAREARVVQARLQQPGGIHRP